MDVAELRATLAVTVRFAGPQDAVTVSVSGCLVREPDTEPEDTPMLVRMMISAGNLASSLQDVTYGTTRLASESSGLPGALTRRLRDPGVAD